MPIRVLYLITELSIGGAQIALLRTLTHLDRDRFAPSVACLYNGDAPVAQAIRQLGIEVTDLHVGSKANFAGLFRLYSLLRQQRPIILHTHLFHVNLPGRIFGRLAGVPVIINAEHTIAMEPEWRYKINAWSHGLADRITTVSEPMRQFCLNHIGLPANKVVLIYNGVDVSESLLADSIQARLELGVPAEAVVLGAVSRFDPVKGVNYLIEAFARLYQIANLHLVLIGDGPQHQELELLAQQLGVTDRIHWAGFRSDVSYLLPAFDIFVQPSVFEGLPMSVLEAMAAQLPVVATAVGGTPELVINGGTGWLVSPRDPAALAQTISSLISNPSLRQQMGQAGLERVRQNFSAEQMTRRTEALYEELLANHAGQR